MNTRTLSKTLLILILASIVIIPNIPFTPVADHSPVRSQTLAATGSSSSSVAPTTFVRIYSSKGDTPISDLTKKTGLITFYVVVNNTLPFTAFLVSIRYSQVKGVLSTPKYTGTGTGPIDAKNNMLGPLDGTTDCPSNAPDTCAKLFRYCIDGANVVDINVPCTSYDGIGVVTYGLYLLGDRTSSGTNGNLFRLNLNVTGTGFEQVQVVFATLANGVAALSGTGTGQINVGTEDSYFTNLDCPKGSGSPCEKMNNDFTLNPPLPSIGRIINFTAVVVDLNPGAKAVNATWSWGDGSLQSVQVGNQIGKPTDHPYLHTCFCAVTLLVTDNYGVAWSFTKIVQVVNIFISVIVSPPSADPSKGVIVGTPVHLSAVVNNNSTVPVANATIILSVEGKLLKSQSFSLDANGGTGSLSGTLSVTWNTTGLIPRVYRIDATVPPVTNQNFTATNTNYSYSYVQFILPAPSGAASLSLLQTTGIGLVVLVGAGFALVRLRKKPSYLDEPV